MGDAVWDRANKTLFKSPDLCEYELWRQTVCGKQTCTVDMCIALNVQKENHATHIGRKDVAHALHQRNVLRVTESIHISPSGRFCSIKFKMPQLM